MRGYLKALIILLFFLAILMPFASDAPDGLERVVETLGVQEHEPAWRGLMPDYTLPPIKNSYPSTFLAGVFGVFLVLGVAFMLGMTLSKRKN